MSAGGRGRGGGGEEREGESFAARWARRKAAARAGRPIEEPGEISPASPEREAAAAVGERADPNSVDPDWDDPSLSEAELAAKLELPDPASLSAGDDFKPFLRAGVPARLKRAALRRLWRSDPALVVADGLLEYGEDFTDAATVVSELQTAWDVGTGFKRKLDRLAAERAAAASEKAATSADAPVAPSAEEPDAEPETQTRRETQTAPERETASETANQAGAERQAPSGVAVAAAAPLASAAAADPEPLAPAAGPRRRMRFSRDPASS